MKHVYEIAPNGGPPFIIVPRTRMEQEAEAYLLAHPECEDVRFYHTHPSPGPQRRFCGVLTRDELGASHD